ncbi:hypothetical protein NEOLEDRAFT_795321 [Neolentinus lepideus HHB14362 ss-1]|uniref:Chromo domain-containing protein n=1 Tax=Neolentinus lepideus HHB14362 ss-1 TaxID=1314782 RepID=A0A165PLA3_9AGAM|nr:hypothetical protein NEOLEDRAFT_795321 [Neolentinus lepideus HHB14362 ss-1]
MMGYLVKWKGYDERENSWVTEQDAQNAREVIDAYWDKIKKNKKGGRKSDVKAKPASVSVKISRAETPDEESSTAAKKRRRSRKVDSDDEMDVEEVAPKKSTRTSRASTVVKPATPAKQTQTRKKVPVSGSGDEEDEDMDEDAGIGNMSQYYNKKNWESLIAKVDTVEQMPNGKLIVYFTTTDGKRVKEDSRICKEKFPQSLINFYESNLRWKVPES